MTSSPSPSSSSSSTEIRDRGETKDAETAFQHDIRMTSSPSPSSPSSPSSSTEIRDRGDITLDNLFDTISAQEDHQHEMNTTINLFGSQMKDLSYIEEDEEERHRKSSEESINSGYLDKLFEPQPESITDTNILSTTEINMIDFPKQFSRNLEVLEEQIKSILQSIQNIRPINERKIIMPGLRNFYGNSRNKTSKDVRNICYMNAIIFVLSSCDSIVLNALSYLQTNRSWSVNVDLLEEGRGKTKTTAKPVVIGRTDLSFAENLSTLLVAMRSKNLPRILEEAYNYKESRVILDATKVVQSFYETTEKSVEKRGMNVNELPPG